MMLSHKYINGEVLNWEENNALLESYAKRLKSEYRNNDNEACQDACLDILKWGGVIRENQRKDQGTNQPCELSNEGRRGLNP